MIIDFKFKMPNFKKAFEKEKENLLNMAAAVVQTQRAQIFDNEGAYNGRSRWKPLKFRKGQILSKSGDLRRSIAPRNDGIRPGTSKGTILQFSGSKITVGSDLIYAAIQNFGGVVTAKNAKALKIPLGNGKFMFRKKVTIPARPFLDWTSQDQTELNDTITNKLKDIWNNAEA